MSTQVQKRAEAKPAALLAHGSTVLLYLLADLFCILISFYLTYIIRFDFERLWSDPLSSLQLGQWLSNEHFQSHLSLALGMGAFLIALLYHNKLYSTERGVRYSHEFVGTLSSVLWTLAFGVIISFLFERFVISRFVLLTYTALLFPTLFTWRFAKRKFAERLFAMGYGRQNVLIVGAGRMGRQLQALLEERRWLGLQVVGFLDDHAPNGQILGPLRDFEQLAESRRVREVFITIPSEREKVLEIATKAHQMGISVKVVPELFNLLTRELEFETLGPFTVAKLFRPTLAPGQRFLKRVEDLIVVGLLSIAFAPLAALIAVAIKLDSRGPIIFKQTRLGEGGRPFTLYKFRSMYVNTDEAQHRELASAYVSGQQGLPVAELYQQVKSRAVTRVGRVIRKFNLDEIPQLWNVLVGDLSLIGPRPALPYEYEAYEEFYKKRLLVKPGITGLWQVSCEKYQLDFEQLVMMDIRYINEWSLWLDLRILLETVPHMLRGRGL